MPEQTSLPLLGRTTAELAQTCGELGQPAYRGRQIAHWLYQQGVRDIAAMTDLPTPFRARLAELAPVGRGRLGTVQESVDGTRKLLLELTDAARVEAVALPSRDRLSVCVSSQTGCAVGCTFCATGYLGAGRNLTAGEIVDQVLTAGEVAGARVSHVVFMGMGEPLLNYDQVLRAVRLLSDEVGLSQRQLTLSTIGLPPQMRRLAGEDLRLTLAVSLHAGDDDLRRRLIPTAAERWSVADVLAAARAYQAGTGRRVTYEVVLLAGVNDQRRHAEAIAQRLKPGEHVNLIPFNPIDEAGFGRTEPGTIARFKQILERARLTVTQRRTRGRDIDGACGQLRAAEPA